MCSVGLISGGWRPFELIYWNLWETSLRWFGLWDMVGFLLEAALSRWVRCDCEAADMVNNNAWAVALKCVLFSPKFVKKTIPLNWTTTSSVNCSCFQWVFLHIMNVFALQPECCSRSQDSSNRATFFKSSVVHFLLACMNCSLGLLLLPDSSDSQSGLLLVWPIWFHVSGIQRCSPTYFCCNQRWEMY